jgi:hypothetical protein
MEDTKLTNSTKTSLKLILLGILIIQFSLVIALYNSMIMGLASLSQLWLGLNLLVLAAFLSVYQFGLKQRKFVLFQFR